MKRLREQASSSDPLIARALALLSALRPLDTARIRRRPLPSDAKARPKALQMRVALALAVGLASAVAGAATLRRAGWLSAFTFLEATTSVRPSPASPRPTGPAPHNAASGSPSAPLAYSRIAPESYVRPALAAPPAPRATVAAMPAHAAAPIDSRASVLPSDESAIVVDAVRALRRDRDPHRAGKLAEEALQQYPHGAQTEEAMAIAMEAAFAEGDTAAARNWAERYLSMFATGRFADRARQMLSAPSR